MATDTAVNTAEDKVGGTIFVAFHLAGGQVGMSLILVTTLLSQQIKRHAILVNFYIIWMLYSLSYLLSFYAGQNGNWQRKFSLCVTQAAMVYGAPPAIGVSGFVFVLHILLVLRSAIFQHSTYNPSKFTLSAMLSAPYIFYTMVFIFVLFVGINLPEQVVPSSYYCYIKLRSVAHIAPGITIVALGGAIIIEIVIAVILYQNWQIFRSVRGEKYITVHFMLRVLMFTLFSLIALLICAADLSAKIEAFNLLVSSLPIGAFLIFGSQADLLHVWHFHINGGKFICCGHHETQVAVQKMQENIDSGC